MAESAFFWDRLAKRYSKQAIANPDAYEHKLEVSRRYFNPDARALELGCGTGSTALLHAPYLQHIFATDISTNMIKIADTKASQQNIRNVTFRIAAVSEVELPEPVDIVFALSFLHLVEDKEQVIRKVYDWLKPGGVFITSTVTLSNTASFWRYILPIGSFLRILPLVNFFTQDELEKSFTDTGFDIDYKWRPEDGDSVFIVCKKPG